ncbi:MAG TPA: hypothetical protein DEP00_04810 [Lachnospiraceae bacterium]|nr:hypothetical protein [Lachnospiraceae bacterium]
MGTNTIIDELFDDYSYLLAKYRKYSRSVEIDLKKINNDIDHLPENKIEKRELYSNYHLERFASVEAPEVFERVIRFVYLLLLNGREIINYEGEEIASKIIRYSQSNHVLMNCREQSIVLTEILVSLGYKAKTLCCMPIDLYPSENHTMTIVYFEEKSKWVLLDAANCCVFLGEDKQLLSPMEFRNRLIENKEITVRRCFAPNQRKEVTLEGAFRRYLVKNFFRFYIDLTDMKPGAEYRTIIHLIPKGFLPEEVKKFEDPKRIIYSTSNAKQVWCLI